jgi:hypothetical protein
VLPLLGAAMVIGSIALGNKEDIGDWAEAAWQNSSWYYLYLLELPVLGLALLGFLF